MFSERRQYITPICGTMRTAPRPFFDHQITTYDEKTPNAVEDGSCTDSTTGERPVQGKSRMSPFVPFVPPTSSFPCSISSQKGNWHDALDVVATTVLIDSVLASTPEDRVGSVA
jgi:hypothetical protein